MNKYLQDRERDERIVRFLRLLAEVASRDADRPTRDWVRTLLSKVEHLIVSRSCSIHDVLEHLNTCLPSETTLIDDERTPAQRPSALGLEEQRKGMWRKLFDRMWWE